MVDAACPKLLVSTGWVAERLDDPALRIYDCTMLQTPDPQTTYRVRNMRGAWAAAHIPGSGYIDLAKDLSSGETALRFMLAPIGQLTEALERLGIGNGNLVVLYSAANASWATRVWWVLRYLGFDNAAVLDGGLAKWRNEGRPLSTAPCRYPRARFVPRARPELLCDRGAVLAAIGDPVRVIVNALLPEQHAGTGGVAYGRAGRIAGSVNVPGRHLTDAATGTFLGAGELRQMFAQAGVTREREVIAYCGGGIAASAVAFALALLGHENVRLYDASLQEWAVDGSLPMECG